MFFLQYYRIPHEVIEGQHNNKSPRSKVPFIELNGKMYTDSGLIIERLNEAYYCQVDSGLSDQEKLIAHAFIRMIEEHLQWGFVYGRFGHDRGFQSFSSACFPQPLRTIVSLVVRTATRKALWGQGTSRYHINDLLHKFRADLRTIDQFLGEGPFFFGKKSPHLVDMSLFGVMSMVMDVSHFNIVGQELHQFKHLLAFKERMDAIDQRINKTSTSYQSQ
eukprot:TRINITY_DN6868_c0_g1_i3.p1 TRINITY_DN6868_c0_g1~~TRINITY_DN6868_c0_g1_i3.p1  ORF type:complete len:219 (-),score=36.32 TRINITY_DN6868_c0_g1_i3:59-715(-)